VLTVWGANAERVCVPEAYAVEVPEDLGQEALAALQAGRASVGQGEEPRLLAVSAKLPEIVAAQCWRRGSESRAPPVVPKPPG
jgi:hypothetical protein